MKTKADQVIDKHNQLKADKQLWLTQYQTIGEYVMTRKQDFISERTPGLFYNKVFDPTAPNAVHVAASAMIGALWPNSDETFEFTPIAATRPSDIYLPGFDDEEEFFRNVTKVVAAVVADPEAGFAPAFEEYMIDQLAFGISGIFVEDTGDIDVPVRFKAIDVKAASVDESEAGFIDTVYIEEKLTVRQLAQRYGMDKISEKSRKLLNDGKFDEKVSVLQAIEPRPKDERLAVFGKNGMPIASIHIEMDGKHILRESGFKEMPIFVTRFWKVSGEKYGRSPAMAALPDILDINVLREAHTTAVELWLKPPLGVFDDGAFGGGVINLSSGAVSIIHSTGRVGVGHKPVEPLITINNPDSVRTRLTELTNAIKDAFFLDRLLDLNNQTRMTLGEANIRNELRGVSLGTAYSRQIVELLNPLLKRVFNICMARGLFGVIEGSEEDVKLQGQSIMPVYLPQKIVEMVASGRRSFRINFISPAARIMKSEELLGLQKTTEYVTTVSAFRPEILDNFDVDAATRNVQKLTGAPSDTLHTQQEVKKTRADREQQQAAMADLAAMQQGAQAAKNAGQAAQAFSQTPQGQQQ